MLEQRNRLFRPFALMDQVDLPELENEGDLESWKEKITKEISMFQEMFYDGMDTLAKIRLGWFSTKTDKSNLLLAKALAKRGYDFCLSMINDIHDAFRNFTIAQYKLIKIALEQKKPIQKTMGKVYFIIAAVLQIPAILTCIALTAPFYLYPIITIGVSVVAFVGTLVYEGIKVSNHRKIIKAFLQIQDQIIRLQKLRRR